MGAGTLQIIGRSSSHFTRVPRIFAHALGVPLELVVVHDITSTASDVFAGNPALKLPTLRRPDGGLVFGAENISRVVAEAAGRGPRVVWPESIRADVARNAQELTWHAMAAQVQLVIGTVVGKLPADHGFFVKIRAGLEGAVGWLDAHWVEARAALPDGRDLSLLEVTLFCLLEHLMFRPTVPLEPYPTLRAFAVELAAHPAAQATVYRFDPAPGA